MLEIWNHLLDNGYIIGVILMGLSKAFDVLNHSLLLAKLDTYGFSLKSTPFIQSYCLVFTIDEHLNFNKHTANVCKSASKKLNALSGLYSQLSTEKGCVKLFHQWTIQFLSTYLDVQFTIKSYRKINYMRSFYDYVKVISTRARSNF